MWQIHIFLARSEKQDSDYCMYIHFNAETTLKF